MKHIASIAKRDSKMQLVLVEVYVPNSIDSQGEFCSPETLEKAAHRFNEGGNHKNISVMHNGQRIDASVVESYIAKKGDPLFADGTWAAVIKVKDPQIWQAIEQGVLKGVSFEGKGHSREARINGKKAREMYDLDITTISLVDRPANKRPFKMTKSDNGFEALAATIAQLAKSIEKTAQTVEKRQNEINQRIDALSVDGSGRIVKSAPLPIQNPETVQELRQRDRLNARLSSIWERPDRFPENAEADVVARLEKSEDRLYMLGHQDRETGIDSNSAFYQRGGTSEFLVASISSLDSILGVNRTVSKSEEDEIEVENCLIL